MRATDHQKMSELPDIWRGRLSELGQKKLIVLLLGNLRSTKPAPLRDYEELVRLSRSKFGATPIGHVLVIEAGRCAWALEEMVYCQVRGLVLDEESKQAYKRNHSDEEIEQLLQAAHRRYYEKVIEAMATPVNVNTISAEERLRLARSDDTRQRLLSKLANDSDARVRKAVAENRRTALDVLWRMAETDPDGDVKAAASTNKAYARLAEIDDW